MVDEPHRDSTMLDPRLARPRLHEGIVPPDTGLFLRIEQGGGAGTVYTLSAGGVFLVGRDGADIVLADPKTSRKHAEIALYGPERYFIRDLASTNGTFLNGRRLRDRKELRHQDRIRIGDTVMVFAAVEAAIPVADGSSPSRR